MRRRRRRGWWVTVTARCHFCRANFILAGAQHPGNVGGGGWVGERHRQTVEREEREREFNQLRGSWFLHTLGNRCSKVENHQNGTGSDISGRSTLWEKASFMLLLQRSPPKTVFSDASPAQISCHNNIIYASPAKTWFWQQLCLHRFCQTVLF